MPKSGIGEVIKPNNTANAAVPENVPMTQEDFDRIINLERGNRPPVHDYLSDEYIKAHHALFEQDGIGFIVVEDWLIRDARKGFFTFPADKFVGLKSEVKKIVEEYLAAGKDWRILNERFALGTEKIADTRIVVIYLEPKDVRFKLGIPTGNERGAYKGQWIPGGITKGGAKEMVWKGSENIRHNGSFEILLEQFENFERLQ